MTDLRSPNPAKSTARDYLRQSLNLVLAPAMWILSSIGFISDSARTASEFSDMSDNLLVPLGPAFSIWFPIFVGCIGYGIIQALPKHRTRALFRAVGWWTAAGFACVCGWALITAYAPDAAVQWGTALIFIPAVAALNIATIKFTRRADTLSGLERLFTWVPISLIAGWCSLAIFLNWTPITYDLFAGGEASLTSSLLILAAALGLIVWVCRAAQCNKIYVVPAIWGLGWLAARHLIAETDTPIIGIVALIGILLLMASALWKPHGAKPVYESRST
ncbi:hypothetical protein ACFFUB_06190 [Algimonas porphyrae]|uniref:Tryptophan-rich sensory protein n=1 Tax=Algimonas porphyrae TaxID=1128113 RepID=A0ABQ5V143_9PROT|nr:hypothetical protein [Algimonas porphyrae]GLQ21251.1 hypothetical protein GCM10007854_22060 [Algimonas porphyrae]